MVMLSVVAASVAAESEVYCNPQDVSARFCEEVKVEIWINATETGFQGGQINLTYNPTCANVTDWERNTTNFLMGGWSHYDGREWITFSTMSPQPPLLTGKYMVGTLTIHCVNGTGGGCKTPLAFAEPSRLSDDRGKSVAVTWNNGTFTCKGILDTGAGAYPSISGTHNGTIKPNRTIEVQTLYTYPCAGTGGHTEYARIWNSTLDVNVTWNGYTEDWHNLTFGKPFTLFADEEYNFKIKTGSYPQIHHTGALPTVNGWLNCTDFTDANGRVYYGWIPAIRLYFPKKGCM